MFIMTECSFFADFYFAWYVVLESVYIQEQLQDVDLDVKGREQRHKIMHIINLIVKYIYIKEMKLEQVEIRTIQSKKKMFQE